MLSYALPPHPCSPFQPVDVQSHGERFLSPMAGLCCPAHHSSSPHQPNLCLPRAKPLQRQDVPSRALTTQILASSPCGRQSQGRILPAYEKTVKQGIWASKEGQRLFPYAIRTIAVAPCTGHQWQQGARWVMHRLRADPHS